MVRTTKSHPRPWTQREKQSAPIFAISHHWFTQSLETNCLSLKTGCHLMIVWPWTLLDLSVSQFPHLLNEDNCQEPHLALLTKWRHGPNPLSSSHRHGPRMKELGLVIVTCSFLSSVELAENIVKVLFVLERSMRKHKAFCNCAQKIIYKVTIDIRSRIFTKNVLGWACRPQLETLGRIVIWDLFVKEMFMAKEVCWI